MTARSQKQLEETSEESLNILKERLAEASQDAARVVDDEAHQNPWKFVGIAALISLLIGFFLGRKSKS